MRMQQLCLDSWPWLMQHLCLEQPGHVLVLPTQVVLVCLTHKDLHVIMIDELLQTQQSTGVKGPTAAANLKLRVDVKRASQF